MGFQICIPIFAYRNAYKHQELGGNLRCHRALFFMSFFEAADAGSFALTSHVSGILWNISYMMMAYFF